MVMEEYNYCLGCKKVRTTSADSVCAACSNKGVRNEKQNTLKQICPEINENQAKLLLRTILELRPREKNGCRFQHNKTKPATTCSSGECLFNGAFNEAIEEYDEALRVFMGVE